MRSILILFIAFFSIHAKAQYACQLGLLKYSGGGDWYANLETSVPNLIRFCNDQLKTNINPEQAIVEAGSADIFNLPFVHMTGHGNVIFSESDIKNLRLYLMSGGFLHIDDNYGMDKFIRPQMKKVFPELDFVEVSYDHPIFQYPYVFSSGLPKIHEHDKLPPKGYGLFYKGRLICFYSYECDLGDGWESYEVHKDSEESRIKALKMGANLVHYAFTGGNLSEKK